MIKIYLLTGLETLSKVYPYKQTTGANNMNKHKYLAGLMTMPVYWLKSSAENPSAYMSAVHIKLHYIALRRKGF